MIQVSLEVMSFLFLKMATLVAFCFFHVNARAQVVIDFENGNQYVGKTSDGTSEGQFSGRGTHFWQTERGMTGTGLGNNNL